VHLKVPPCPRLFRVSRLIDAGGVKERDAAISFLSSVIRDFLVRNAFIAKDREVERRRRGETGSLSARKKRKISYELEDSRGMVEGSGSRPASSSTNARPSSSSKSKSVRRESGINAVSVFACPGC